MLSHICLAPILEFETVSVDFLSTFVKLLILEKIPNSPIFIFLVSPRYDMAAVHLCKRSLFIKVLPKICISLKAKLCVRKPFVCIHRWIISLGVFDSLLLMWCWWWQHRSSKVHNTSSHIHLNTHHIYYISTRNFCVQVHSAVILAWGIVGDCKRLAKKVQLKCFLESLYHGFPI